jgi:hypothetical protein
MDGTLAGPGQILIYSVSAILPKLKICNLRQPRHRNGASVIYCRREDSILIVQKYHAVQTIGARPD